MMNSQEMETAVRLKLDIVVIILNDSAYGMIKWKQEGEGFDNFGLDYQNPWGFYLGGFAYNRDSREVDNWLESNAYAGWAGGYQDFSWGGGIIHYEFDGPDEGYDEYTTSLGWRFLRFSSFHRDDGTENYYDVQANAHIWDNMGFIFGVGVVGDRPQVLSLLLPTQPLLHVGSLPALPPSRCLVR